MTINDPELSPWATLIHKYDRLIDKQTRDGEIEALRLSYIAIRNSAEYALERLTRIKPVVPKADEVLEERE